MIRVYRAVLSWEKTYNRIEAPVVWVAWLADCNHHVLLGWTALGVFEAAAVGEHTGSLPTEMRCEECEKIAAAALA